MRRGGKRRHLTGDPQPGLLVGWHRASVVQGLLRGGVAATGVGWSSHLPSSMEPPPLPSWHLPLRCAAFPALGGWRRRPLLEPLADAQAPCQWDESRSGVRACPVGGGKLNSDHSEEGAEWLNALWNQGQELGAFGRSDTW